MYNPTERRLEILSLLSARRSDTVSNLALEFGVSKNTIYRDIDKLSNKHPIYTTQGNGGGVHMVEGISANKKYLSQTETNLLIKIRATLNQEEAQIITGILSRLKAPERGL